MFKKTELICTCGRGEEIVIDNNADRYQRFTLSTAIYRDGKTPLERLTYVTLGLCGEAGEVGEVVKKVIRDDNGILSEEKREKLKGELGDAQYYLARLADEAGFALSEIMAFNQIKLQSRKERGVIQGSGSER